MSASDTLLASVASAYCSLSADHAIDARSGVASAASTPLPFAAAAPACGDVVAEVMVISILLGRAKIRATLSSQRDVAAPAAAAALLRAFFWRGCAAAAAEPPLVVDCSAQCCSQSGSSFVTAPHSTISAAVGRWGGREKEKEKEEEEEKEKEVRVSQA